MSPEMLRISPTRGPTQTKPPLCGSCYATPGVVVRFTAPEGLSQQQCRKAQENHNGDGASRKKLGYSMPSHMKTSPQA